VNPQMELVEPQEEPAGEQSPLARARLHRQLTVEEAARRAGLTTDEVRWLEEGRVYRFASPDDALLAAVLYGTAIGIHNREARELAGLPVPASQRYRLPRVLVLGGLALAAAALVSVFALSRADTRTRAAATAQARLAAALPPPWRIRVSVLNGSGDINYTRRVASRIGSLAYRIVTVDRADRFDYRQTAVYFPPGAEQLALRLAKQLGVATQPLPGGKDRRHLYVIVGPRRGPGE
jgi:transcriptional regulator with XRE-family HTH domain